MYTMDPPYAFWVVKAPNEQFSPIDAARFLAEGVPWMGTIPFKAAGYDWLVQKDTFVGGTWRLRQWSGQNKGRVRHVCHRGTDKP